MASTTLVLITQWAHDHFNTEMATMTIENYELIKIGGAKNLSSSNLPDYIIESAKKIKEAQNVSVFGETEVVGLYQVVDSSGKSSTPDGIHGISNEPNKDYQITLNLRPICKFDKELKPVPFK